MKKLAVLLSLLVMFAAFNANAQDKKMTVGITPGVVLPIGDMKDVAKMGFGASLNFGYYFTENIQAGLSAGYIMFGEKKYDLGITTVKSNVKFMPIMATGSYYFIVDKPIKPYGTIGFGMTMWKTEAKAGGITAKDDGSKLSWAVGAGADYSLNDNMNLNLNVKYNSVMEDPALNYIGINIGAAYKF